MIAYDNSNTDCKGMQGIYATMLSMLLNRLGGARIGPKIPDCSVVVLVVVVVVVVCLFVCLC